MSVFEPKIVAFLCNWCAYAGADLAGMSRIQYAPNLLVVRVMCSGMVEPTFVLAALQTGADGVLIGGCHFGDCHYRTGNYKAARRAAMLKKVMKQLGVDEERVNLEWISASEANHFAQVASDMTAKIKELGPFAGKTAYRR